MAFSKNKNNIFVIIFLFVFTYTFFVHSINVYNKEERSSYCPKNQTSILFKSNIKKHLYSSAKITSIFKHISYAKIIHNIGLEGRTLFINPVTNPHAWKYLFAFSSPLKQFYPTVFHKKHIVSFNLNHYYTCDYYVFALREIIV